MTAKWVEALLKGLYSGDISGSLAVGSPVSDAKSQLAAVMRLLRDSDEFEVSIQVVPGGGAELDADDYRKNHSPMILRIPVCSPATETVMRQTLLELVHEALHVLEAVAEAQKNAAFLKNKEIANLLEFIQHRSSQLYSQRSQGGSISPGDRELFNTKSWIDKIRKSGRNPDFKHVTGHVFSPQQQAFVPGPTIVINDYLAFWLLGFDPGSSPWPNDAYEPRRFLEGFGSK